MGLDWRRIVADHGDAVWKIVRALLGNDVDARDCYQIAFLEALRYSRRRRVDDWERLLNRIARRRAIDHLRKRYRSRVSLADSAKLSLVESRSPSASEQAEAAELAEQLRAGLSTLTQRQAGVFVMRFVEQLSYDEIAARTGSTPNAVGAMLARIRVQLRQHLERSEPPATSRRGTT